MSLARFNEQIFAWPLATRDNDVYRALYQNQEKMTFSVFGFTITLQRIRVTVISFVIGVLCKSVVQLVMDAAKEEPVESATELKALNPNIKFVCAPPSHASTYIYIYVCMPRNCGSRLSSSRPEFS